MISSISARMVFVTNHSEAVILNKYLRAGFLVDMNLTKINESKAGKISKKKEKKELNGKFIFGS